MNPFWRAVLRHLQYERVTVKTAQGDSYTGILTMTNHHEDAFLLSDVTTSDGESRESVMIREPATVERVDDDGPSIETVDFDHIAPQPYSVRSFDDPDFHEFVRSLRTKRGIGKYPIVRPYDGEGDIEYQVVSGHRRVAAIREAGVDPHPVQVEPLSDWEAAVRFIDEHFPLPGEAPGRATTDEGIDHDSSFYSPRMMYEAFQRLLEDWEQEQLFEHPAIAANEEWILGTDPADTDSDDEEGAGDAGDDDVAASTEHSDDVNDPAGGAEADGEESASAAADRPETTAPEGVEPQN